MNIRIIRINPNGIGGTRIDLDEKDVQLDGFWIRDTSGHMKRVNINRDIEEILIELKSKGPNIQ